MAQRDPQAGTNTQPALTGFPPQPTSATADAASPTLTLGSWLIRLGLLAAGLLAMRQALYIFYFQPWLGAKSGLDPWLERNRCLVTAWCGPDALPLHHGGVLLLLAALLCFGWALRTRPEDWPASVLPVWPAWLSRPRATRIAVLLFCLMAAEAILYAFYQRWAGGASPTVLTWVAGAGALLTAAILWDLEERAEWAHTVTGLLAYAGIAVATLGAGALLARSYATALLLPAGIGLVWLAGRRSRRPGGWLHALDYWLMLGFALLALTLAMLRSLDWRVAFVGDEWGFYRVALAILADAQFLRDPFWTQDPSGYHTLLPSIFQAGLMQITRVDVYGWRLSSVLPFVWSVPAVYVIGGWLAGRTAAWLGAALYAGSHALLTFSLIPYNNTFALLATFLALAGLIWAERGLSATRYVLVGIILGAGYLMHGLALLAALPVGLLLAGQTWPDWRRLATNGGMVAAGFVAAAAPLMVNLAHWAALLKATPVQSEVAAKFSIGEQMARNATAGIFAFVADVSSRYSHFVAAGHTEPVTAVLLLMGVGATLAGLRHARRVRSWWLATGLFWLAVAAIQQYGYLSITRMFVLVPVYAVLAGVGGTALARLLIPFSPVLRQTLAVLLALAGLGLSEFHIERISLALNRDTWSLYPFLIQQLQTVAAQDADATVVVVTKRPDTKLTGEIVEAYGLAAHTPTLMSGGDFLASEELCAAGDRPVIVLVTPDLVQPERIRRKFAACWTGYDETVLIAPWDRPILYRYATASAAQTLPPLDKP